MADTEASQSQQPKLDQTPDADTPAEEKAGNIESDGAKEQLPKLSAADFRVYNRMAEVMDSYHNHFRRTWTILYNGSSTGKRPAGMTIKQFLSMAEGLCSQLELHHGIEEAHIFPILARKMPAFRKELHLLTQHKEIHRGLDQLRDYCERARTGAVDFQMSEFKTIMDSFGTVLWAHLDDEVRQLGADNMRRYWTLQEMRGMPM